LLMILYNIGICSNKRYKELSYARGSSGNTDGLESENSNEVSAGTAAPLGRTKACHGYSYYSRISVSLFKVVMREPKYTKELLVLDIPIRRNLPISASVQVKTTLVGNDSLDLSQN
jgi:hypothetical protein